MILCFIGYYSVFLKSCFIGGYTYFDVVSVLTCFYVLSEGLGFFNAEYPF